MTKLFLSRREFLGSSGAALEAAGISQQAGAAEADQPGSLYFEALTKFGLRLNNPIAQRWGLDDLKSDTKPSSISGALVSFTPSNGYEPYRP